MVPFPVRARPLGRARAAVGRLPLRPVQRGGAGRAVDAAAQPFTNPAARTAVADVRTRRRRGRALGSGP